MKAMRKWFFWSTGFVVVAVVVLAYLLATGKRGLLRLQPVRAIEVSRLDDAQTEKLGWRPRRLDAVFEHVARLSSDTFVIVTKGETVASFGNLSKPYATHSIRKSILSALVGRYFGNEPQLVPLNATLLELGIDDMPRPLGDLQKQATVRHLLMSTSGINHTAAAEGGLRAEKTRRLGNKENKPGVIWAYNNWDYNALTSIFEMRTGRAIGVAFRDHFAIPTGMKDFSLKAVSYIRDPARSKHPAVAIRMSARDLVKFGRLFLDKGTSKGQQILPNSWVDRIVREYSETGRNDLRWGHGYLWWLPSPETGLPKGTFWAWGLSNQALFVIPGWDTVIVHQADTTEFRKRFFPEIQTGKKDGETLIKEMILACRERANRETNYCIEHRFVTRQEFARLISLVVEARR